VDATRWTEQGLTVIPKFWSRQWSLLVALIVT